MGINLRPSFAELNADLRDGVADEGDKASAWQLADIDAALRQHREATKPPPQWVGDDGTVLCLECGLPIPLERLERHPDSAWCVPCLSEIEHRKKQGLEGFDER